MRHLGPRDLMVKENSSPSVGGVWFLLFILDTLLSPENTVKFQDILLA